MKEPELTKYTWYKKANENFIISKGFFLPNIVYVSKSGKQAFIAPK